MSRETAPNHSNQFAFKQKKLKVPKGPIKAAENLNNKWQICFGFNGTEHGLNPSTASDPIGQNNNFHELHTLAKTELNLDERKY